MQLLSFFTEVDIKTKSSYSLYHVGLENYFDKDNYSYPNVMEAYKKLLITNYMLVGESRKNANNNAENVIKLEKDFSKNQLSSSDGKDLNIIYNKVSISDLNNYYKYIDIKNVLSDIVMKMLTALLLQI